MQTINVVLKDKEAIHTDTTKRIYSYFSSVVPRVGEILQIKYHPTYKVVNVIHVLENGNASIILEVKEFSKGD